MLNDETLVEALISGKEESIDDIILRYRGVIYNIAANLCHDGAYIDEIVEEVFVRLCMEITKYKGRNLESLIHEFTYDASLSRLVGSSKSSNENFYFDLGDAAKEEDFNDTSCSRLKRAGSGKESLTKAKKHLKKAINLMNEATKILDDIE